ncbi:MAG: bifunctional 4-hydroxy-2-oxoglutarate aldolase/2-dehydro-3-deoxy-phosphogluconate aldolase [Planctomycetaceae bacterium]|nr:bifunctional 4-hydroxy-2-oxoglutarate aldolase/2-dehydro-3-deoxy-phosphogluconate aldolase [Planctomycetaceae bacterium]
MAKPLTDHFSEALYQQGVIPVIVLEQVADAVPLAEALGAGDLSVLEITLRSSVGLECIQTIAKYNRWMVGAGTVLNRDDARRAIDSGAQFVVSPGLDDGTVQYCQDRNIPIVPGVCTPSEAQRAIHMGLRLVKFFPAEAFGGVATLKALRGPFPNLKFVPTGGIGLETLDAYLELPNVLAVGGSWMVARALLESKNFSQITQLAHFARDRVKNLRHEGLGNLG